MKDIIILPTYNERDNIAPLIKEIFSIVPNVSIMVVDDNSPDGTALVVEELIVRYPRLSILKRKTKNGLRGAYIEAFKKILKDSDIRHIVMMDADFSHHPRYLPNLFRMAKEYDLVIGSRYVCGGGVAEWETWRRWLSIGGNFYVRSILRHSLRDWTAGFACINAGALRAIDLTAINLSGYAFLPDSATENYHARDSRDPHRLIREVRPRSARLP